MGKSLLPLIAGVGLAAATGGLGAGAVGAAGGTGAAGAGAGAGGLGLAGDALAAQGAAGLLGGAGAAAAGYGMPTAMGAGALGGVGASGIEPATASFGPNGEFTGNTIASELSPNSYTGGYDSLNGLERIGQRVGGLLDNGGMDKLGKLKNAFGGQQEHPQQAQNREITGQPVQAQPEQQGQVPYVYGQPSVQFTDEQKRRLYAMQRQGLMYG